MTDRARSRPRVRPQAEWLALGAAARLIGVDPDTLRRWADDGRVEVFTTPGGHRRFRRAALESLTSGRARKATPLRALGATQERLAAAYRREYRSAVSRGPARVGSRWRPATAALAASATGPASDPAIPGSATAAPTTSGWMRARTVPPLDTEGIGATGLARPEIRAAFRADGRRLLAALVGALEAEPAERFDREQIAAELCARMARRLAAEGHGLTDSMTAFVVARRPFLAEIGRLGARRTLDAARLARLYDDAAALLDWLFLHFVAAHQAAEAELARGGVPATLPAPSQ